MELISSDTSVWIDYSAIRRLELPFRLPFTYIMCKDAVDDELLSPPGLGAQLISWGLVAVDITIEEFYLSQEFGPVYPKLSRYDRIALAIAKERRITLLTGDKALRNAAQQEKVHFMGTLGILDLLLQRKAIDKIEMRYCLNELKANNGRAVRLPVNEIEKRLASL